MNRHANQPLSDEDDNNAEHQQIRQLSSLSPSGFSAFPNENNIMVSIFFQDDREGGDIVYDNTNQIIDLLLSQLVRLRNRQLYKRIGPYRKIRRDSEMIQNCEKCSICLEEYVPNMYYRKLQCDHIFHKKCVDKWFKKAGHFKCPICRNEHKV